MMYGNYGRNSYSGYGGYSEGNYNEGNYGGNYGRRGVKGSGRGRRYRGEDMIEEMHEHYGNYSEGREQMGRGNYGAEGMTEKAFDYMLKTAKDFFMFLFEDADNQEQKEKIKMTAREISEMR